MVADTSLLANGKVNKTAQCVRVLGMLKKWKHGRTNSELASVLRLPQGTVAGRINELKKSGAVREIGRRRCLITGHTAKIHQVVES
ncbi:hypothetical protein [uncultured Microbulbifer sp.]|uniref:hypothetical protein n=1 Tax=uncultured Microbulbifer sp. TaxID=348147 RepID=UPI0025EFED8B|nr:hypothetical protein [uncultured Microbulbifer sp.]